MKRLGTVIALGILMLLTACATAAPGPVAAPAPAAAPGGVVTGTLQLEGGPIGPRSGWAACQEGRLAGRDFQPGG